MSNTFVVNLPDVTYAEKLNLKMKSESASLYLPYSIKLSKSGESIDETYYNLPTIRGPDSSIVFLKRFLHYNYYNWFTCDSKEYCHEKKKQKNKKIKNLFMDADVEEGILIDPINYFSYRIHGSYIV
ncbi:unnamed protein product [Rhizophagus irregularis]|nr:unnamed protein product [Rhizophagus irregularis]